MRMMLELLVPGVKDAEESDLRAEVLRIAGDRKQCFGTDPKQQGIDLAFVLQGQRGKVSWQRKDHMDVAGGQQVCRPRFKPAITCIGLTLWAMPVSA